MDTRSPLETRALRYLAQREHSRRELEQKLVHLTPSATPEALSAVLDKLEHDGFLSAERVVAQVTRMRRARFGSQRIIQELKAKGIEEHLIHAAMPALQETELDAAVEIWRKKFAKPPASREERGKQIRFMMGRGFSMEIIQRALLQAGEENQ